MKTLVASWHCLGVNRVPCDAGGEGTPAEVDLAARKHQKTTNHGTMTHQTLTDDRKTP